MRKKEPPVLSKEQKELAAFKIKNYVQDNFQADIGGIEAKIMIEFIAENIGVYFYNKGIADASAYMSEKAEDLYLLMKDAPTN